MNSKYNLQLSLLLLLSFVMSACVSEQPSLPETPVVAVQPVPGENPVEMVVEEEVQKELPNQLQELLSKHETIQSVKYVMDDGTSNAVTVSLKGDKIKKNVFRARFGLESYYDTIYVDRDALTAYTHCVTLYDCADEHKNKGIQLNFDEEDVLTPIQIIKSITIAEKVGTERFDGRDTIMIEFTNAAGNREVLWIDTFFGMPLQQRIFNGEVLLEKHTFTEVGFNRIKEADVTLPNTYQIS
jgi:hypothetical protein